MRWEHRRLLVSDAPVLLVAARDWPQWSGVGMLTAGRIVFPIGRQCSLVLVNKLDGELPDGTRLTPTAKGAREVCRRGAYSASRYLYHHPADDLSSLVGAQFTLPSPEPVTAASDHGREVREKVAKMNEYAFEHPDEPHPLARLPTVD
jgi:hypothetical protein